MAAQELLNSGSFASSKVRLQLRDHVEEQLLMSEMMMVHCSRPGSLLPPQHPAALMAKAKSFYTNSHHCTLEPVIIIPIIIYGADISQ